MYNDYYELETMNDFIQNEMTRTKTKVIRLINSHVHFKLEQSNESFIKMFVFCWQESIPAAEKIADEMDLGKLDFLALMNDFDAFKEEFLKQYERAENF